MTKLSNLATLKIEDLTISLPSFDGSQASKVNGSLTARDEPFKSNLVMNKGIKVEPRPTSSCSNDTKIKFNSLADRKNGTSKQIKPAVLE